MAIAWLGFDALIPLTVRMIRGHDLACMAGALRGSQLAILHHDVSPDLRSRVWDEAQLLATGERRVPATPAGARALECAVEALVAIHLGRAVRLFSGAQCLHRRNWALRTILLKLYWLREEGTRALRPLDPGLLWPVYEVARAGKLNDGQHRDNEQLVGALLTFAAERDPERTRAEAKRVLQEIGGEWSQLRDFAKEAIRRCRRIPQAQQALSWVLRNLKAAPIRSVEVMRAYELASHVNTDGFPLYFHNLGEYWKAAHRGLRTMDLDIPAELLASGARTVGRRGAPQTSRDWQRAFGEMSESDAAGLERLGERFERTNDRVIAAVDRYIAAHPEGLGPSGSSALRAGKK